MAKDKEKSVNPAAAHLKSQKNKALKKSKAAVAAQRNEKLARRNPERLQRQVDDLKATQEAQGGQLRPRDREQLDKLEREVKAIRKAREVAGTPEQAHDNKRHDQNASSRGTGGGRGGQEGRRGRGGSTLGKRRRDDHQQQEEEAESEDTDPEVRSIPMPRDTPPPVPRRSRRHVNQWPANPTKAATAPAPAPAPAQTTYSSAPQLRNLQKESTSKFVPAAVAARLKQRKGETGKLLEPEEVDALERGGYLDAAGAANEAGKEAAFEMRAAQAVANGDDGRNAAPTDMDAEEEAFKAEIEGLDGANDDDKGGVLDTAAAREDVLRDARKDVQGVVKEAAEEAQFRMAAEEAAFAEEHFDEANKAEKHLRHVEIEEVEDEAFAT